MAYRTVPPSPIAFGVVLIGAAFSFAITVVPHFDSAHRLLGVPFAASIALYGIYAVIASLTPASVADALGVRLLALHVVMGILLRSAIAPAEVAGMLTLVPVLLTLYALVDIYLRTRGGPKAAPGRPEDDHSPDGISAPSKPQP